MNKKKLYVPPHAEVVLVCNGRILEDIHPIQMSNWTDGHGGGGGIGYGDEEGGAKEYGWDLWEDFDDEEGIW